MTISLFLAVASMLSQSGPIPGESIPATVSKPAELIIEAELPRLRLENISAIFAPHYDAATFPMLAREEVRRSLEEPAYREFYWALTGKLSPRVLLTPYDVVSYIHITRGGVGVVGSEEAHRGRFANGTVSGITFPDTPIRLLTARPIDFLGEWTTDATYQFKGDPYIDHVFAVARCIVEVEHEKYREITLKWMYVPEREKFFPVGLLYQTIHDPLAMLMRLHDVETDR